MALPAHASEMAASCSQAFAAIGISVRDESKIVSMSATLQGASLRRSRSEVECPPCEFHAFIVDALKDVIKTSWTMKSRFFLPSVGLKQIHLNGQYDSLSE